MKSGIKVFSGKYLEELIAELDQWLEKNNASLFGQGAIKQRRLADETYEITLKYVLNN
ncbi:hypothetical protein [Periweissella ghanensis]|uniref:Uncharacterized protein n=1 Tax=Periweissella ghanensis TaxID=467997 RepID=A0ABM8ZAM9_9LACO|nr:hypothetical protein [Periweissella ghanensis]MCM0600792.1 hypothetical protein [Periweissella ghanensis]CAH0418566.1 hypothetical protein WGH24286_00987 [Periweissella ghanensis]